MKCVRTIVSGLALAGILALAVAAQTSAAPQTNPATGPITKGKTSASKKTAQAKTTGEPQSDADIQSCITKRLAAAPKLKTQGLSATVSEGVATFIGTAANPGSKGGVYSLAKSCGAKQIVNHITVQASGKSTAKAVTPAKPAQGESPKKP